MGAGPWPTIVLLLMTNFVVALFTGDTLNLMTLSAAGIMVVSLVIYVGLIGSGGSDVFGVGSTAVGVTRAAAMIAFIASVVAVVATNSIQFSNPIITFANVVLGGLAIFQSIGAAKPGAA